MASRPKRRAAASASATATAPDPSSSSSAGEDEYVLPTQPQKKAKIAPIFNLARESNLKNEDSTFKFTWHPLIGPKKSCLHGSFKDPKPSAKLALFDLDGTIVRPKGGKTFPSAKDEYDYQFCYPGVVERIRKEHAEGYSIVIITNQKQTQYTAKGNLETWKRKMGHISRALDVPLRVFAALAFDIYRKPALGMWHELLTNWNGGVAPDLETSYFVGDAAGRKNASVRDHGDTDYKWALNAGLRFYTPEHFFLDKEHKLTVPTRPWEGAVDADGAQHAPQAAALEEPEVVLFVGAPGSGKTALYRRIFEPAGYVWVNQDTLRSRDRCIKEVERALEAGKSCIVDNTNRDRATRKHYVDLARRAGVRIRCFHFDTPKHVCMHNNLVRAMGAGPTGEAQREVVPVGAIESFFKDVQVPTLEEGFHEEPLRIVWKFEGDTDLYERYHLYYH